MSRDYEAELVALNDAHLYRELKAYKRNGMMVMDNQSSLIDFSSNDYLGLAQHPALKEAALLATEQYGVGSSASRLVSGTTPAHEECETVIAKAKQVEKALLFSTGFMAAMATIPALLGKDDVIILDKLSHACLIDASRASGARLRVFPHNKVERLAALLQNERARAPEAQIMIIVESVYSMDGDLCPLAEIVALKERYGALLLVDEAHGLGVLGERGMGLAEALNVTERIELQMGTLGKAAGGAGGYIATSAVLAKMIINKGRSFIYTTAPPPAQAAVAQRAFQLIISQEGQSLRHRLLQFRQRLGKQLDGKELSSAICPVILGESSAAIAASARLRKEGLLIPAIRYPTVAPGQARLRITLSALHSEEQFNRLLEAIATL